MNEIAKVTSTNESEAEAPLQQTSEDTLSKNQKKRLIKEEHRRQAKQKKKEESKKRKREASGGADRQEEQSKPAAADAVYYPPHDEAAKKERKQKEADEYAAKCAKNFSIILDCAWEDKHNDQTMKSLTQQIMFCYGINRRHECPAPMYMTGVGPQVTHNLNKSNFSHWQGVTITAEDYLSHPHFSVEAQPASTGSAPSTTKQLVYLTSDAEETLETLEPNCAYIIGGIVDRNRHKFATFNKAKAQGVRVAKLPIKENFALAATHILTVNHVYNILLNYAKYQDWVQAIKEVMPNRKGPVELTSTNETGEANEATGIVEDAENVVVAAASPVAGDESAAL